MYDPAAHRGPNFAFIWPALIAASASEMASLFASELTRLAVGGESADATEPAWSTPNETILDLATVRLRSFAGAQTGAQTGAPVLLCAPFALHGAVVTDFASRHSLVGALRDAGIGRLFVTDWKSATHTMRFLAIDDYLADLNVLVDEIGPPIDLIGLCQGGWLAMMYAARFPKKVRKLVLAASPIDIGAAPSAVSALADAGSLAIFRELVRLGDGVVPGRKMLKFWGPEAVDAGHIRNLLDPEEPAGSPGFARLEAAFRMWHAWTVDLPGSFFIETVERLFRGNELARGSFMALGHRIDLAAVTTPIFMLAAAKDELVAPEQLFAAAHLVGTPPHLLRKTTAPCTHLGLFMNRSILRDVWPGIVRWLQETEERMLECA